MNDDLTFIAQILSKLILITMKSTLSGQELKDLRSFKDQWRDYLVSTEAVDPEKIREAIVDIYTTKDFSPPEKILFVDSFPGLLMLYCKLSKLPRRTFSETFGPRIPLVCNYRKSLRPTDVSPKKSGGRAESDPTLLETVYTQLKEPLDRQFANFRNELQTSITEKEYLETPSRFWRSLRKNVTKISDFFKIDLNREEAQAHLQETEQSDFRRKVLNICNFYGNLDANLVAPAALYLEEWNWNHPQLENHKPKITLCKNAGPVILFDNLAMVSRRPDQINVRNNGFHCETGPSVQWGDGSALFHIENEQFSKHVVMNPGTISSEKILNASNLKRQRILLEQFGYENFIENIDACFENSDEYGYLYRIKNTSFEDFVFVRVEDASTNRKYTLRAKPSVACTKEAVAQSFGFDDQKDYDPRMQT